MCLVAAWHLGTCQKPPQDERACSVAGSELEGCDTGHGDKEPCPTTHFARRVKQERRTGRKRQQHHSKRDKTASHQDCDVRWVDNLTAEMTIGEED